MPYAGAIISCMKLPVGKTFSIADDNKPVKGCTISNNVHAGENAFTVFSMAKNTDISAEIFPYYKFIIVNCGRLEIYGAEDIASLKLSTGESCLTPIDTPVGFRAAEDTVFVEIEIRRNDKMNEAIKPGEVFSLAEKLPYADGRIVNMDVVHNDKMKFALMAFDAGEALSEHSAPGEALIFALDGEGEIGYEGKTYAIKAGENFHFAKNGKHWVKATTKFKMALLLTLD